MNNIFQNIAEIKNVLPQGKTFTLVGGCFDLVHVGHVHLLEYAASLEELLVVVVLSDKYARKYKDSQRPIINQKQRTKMIASMRFVDYVCASDTSPGSIETLKLLKPSSVVFGEDSKNTEKMQLRIKNIASASPDTRVWLLPRYSEEEVSTSSIIDKIRNATS